MRARPDGSAVRELAGIDGARLWSMDLDQPAPVVARLQQLLSIAERGRAEALPATGARRRFVVRRGMLRTLLGEVTGTAPERLVFQYGPDGKPSLAPSGGSVAWHFNLSDAREIAVFAVAADRAVGIDVEWIAGSAAIDGVARRFFSAAEQACLDTGPAESRRRRFFRIWVRKEAYLKGRGEGISEWIHTTDFSELAGPGNPTRDQDAWLVRDLVGLPDGYLASIALAHSLGSRRRVGKLFAGNGTTTSPGASIPELHPRMGSRATTPVPSGELAP